VPEGMSEEGGGSELPCKCYLCAPKGNKHRRGMLNAQNDVLQFGTAIPYSSLELKLDWTRLNVEH